MSMDRVRVIPIYKTLEAPSAEPAVRQTDGWSSSPGVAPVDVPADDFGSQMRQLEDNLRKFQDVFIKQFNVVSSTPSVTYPEETHTYVRPGMTHSPTSAVGNNATYSFQTSPTVYSNYTNANNFSANGSGSDDGSAGVPVTVIHTVSGNSFPADQPVYPVDSVSIVPQEPVNQNLDYPISVQQPVQIHEPCRINDQDTLQLGYNDDLDSLPSSTASTPMSTLEGRGRTARRSRKLFEMKIQIEDFKPDEVHVHSTDDQTLVISAKHEQKGSNSIVCKQFNREFTVPTHVNWSRLTYRVEPSGLLVIEAPYKTKRKVTFAEADRVHALRSSTR